ncbi:G5 domain-containing protein [Agromyces bauzanensis]
MKNFWLIVGIVVVIALVLTYWYIFLLIGALIAAVLGVVALVRGRAPRIRSRAAGAVVLTVSLVALGVGGAGAAAATRSPDADTTARVSANFVGSAEQTESAERSPVREVKEVEERSTVPYSTVTVDDSNLAAGSTAIVTAGVNGERTLTYRITYEDGVEISREVISDVVSIPPVDEVVSHGTYVPPPPPAAEPAPSGDCHPSYADECVPFAPDADCAGGGGNGPAYVTGPVRVVGPDVYELDRDGDGIACDA